MIRTMVRKRMLAILASLLIVATCAVGIATKGAWAQGSPNFEVRLGHGVQYDPDPRIRRGESIELSAGAVTVGGTDTVDVRKWKWFRVRKSDPQGRFEILQNTKSNSGVEWTPPITFKGDNFVDGDCDFGPLGGFNIRVRAYDANGNFASGRQNQDGDPSVCVEYENTEPAITAKNTEYISYGGGPVTLSVEACDNDDPMVYDRNTGLCLTGSTKPQDRIHRWDSYLRNPDIYAADGGIRWFSYSGGTLTRLVAPGKANFEPPTSAENGDRFRVDALVFDPDSAVSRNDAPNVSFYITVEGKPEPEPESDFTVTIVEAETNENFVPFSEVRYGQGLELKAVVNGFHKGGLTYDWTNQICTNTCREYTSPFTGRTSFRPHNNPITSWTATRLMLRCNHYIKLNVVVTDDSGVSEDAFVRVRTHLRPHLSCRN